MNVQEQLHTCLYKIFSTVLNLMTFPLFCLTSIKFLLSAKTKLEENKQVFLKRQKSEDNTLANIL